MTNLVNKFNTNNPTGSFLLQVRDGSTQAGTATIKQAADLTIGSNVNFNSLTAGSITGTVTRGATTVGATTTFQANVVCTNRLEDNALVRVTIPQAQFVSSTSMSVQHNNGISTGTTVTPSIVSSDANNYVIQFTEFCTSSGPCADGTTLIFTVTAGITNPAFVNNAPTTYFVFQTLTADGTYTID